MCVVYCKRTLEKSREEKWTFYSTHNTKHKMQWTLAWKACFETFLSGAAFECVELKYVMLFALFIIFVQVFSIQLITKQSEMLQDFFSSPLLPIHMHPKYWHVNNVPSAQHEPTKNECSIFSRILRAHTHCSLFNWQPRVFWHSNTYTWLNGFLIFFAYYYCCLSGLLFQSSYLFFGSAVMVSLLLQCSVVRFFLMMFSLDSPICLNGCFNAVISCFITDKILHLTLTNNMPLRCRCSSSSLHTLTQHTIDHKIERQK